MVDEKKTSSPKNGKTAIVIGAGVGGVSTAARLAKAGFEVTVVEKNGFTGGRCSLLWHEGWVSTIPSQEIGGRRDEGGGIMETFDGLDLLTRHGIFQRFDQGPSLLLLPRLFHRTFEELGTTMGREGVELLKCEPNYKIFFGDGETFTLSTDLAAMKDEVTRWEGRDGYSRYLAFMRESHAHYELSVSHVLLRNFTSLKSMLRLEFLRHLLELHPFESIWGRASRYFWTERLRRVFTFGSMYMGMSPFDAPGTYSLLQYTELAEGIWYPVGGFHRVVQALVEVGERLGVKYRLNTGVEKIVLTEDGSRTTGVRLENGEVLTADVVVNNSDLVYAYENLLPKTPYAESLARRPASCSSISFYWALDRKVPELNAHNIFLANEYKESFDSIFKKHLIPDQPSFYVNVPSRVDPTAAPEGKDSVVVLVPVGHLLTNSEAAQTAKPTTTTTTTNTTTLDEASPPSQPGLPPTSTQDWPAMLALARRTILQTIATRTSVDLTPLITHEQTNTPLTWLSNFNLSQGAILGLSHSFFNVLSFRPSTRARRGGWLDGKLGGGMLGRVGELVGDVGRGANRDVSGLYMVGASVHPGTGVPICLAGGKLVAEQVCADLGVGVPWVVGEGDQGQEQGLEGKRRGKLDRVERGWVERAGFEGGPTLVLLVLLVVFAVLAWGW